MADEGQPARTAELVDDVSVRGGGERAPAGEPHDADGTLPDEVGLGPSGQPENKVFVSYSRRDTAFVEWLAPELTARGHPCWIDWRDIAPTTRWREAVRQAVRGTKAFVFVLTPDSADSVECGGEIDDAVEDGKRIIPLLVREVAPARTHPEIAARQWIACTNEEQRPGALDALVAALERDPEWVEEHTRLLVRAADWERAHDDHSFLLRGSELEEAERWLENAAEEPEPRPTQLHTRYILASRRGAIRAQRRRLSAVAGALVVSLVLASVAVLEGLSAVRHAHEATSRAIAATARAQLGIDPEQSLLLAMRAVKASSPPTPEAYRALREALVDSRVRARLQGLTGAANDAAFSPTANVVAAAWGTSGLVALFDGQTGKLRTPLHGHTDRVRSVSFDADGGRLITAGFDGTARLWDTSTGADLRTLRVGLEQPTKAIDAALAPDGMLAVVGTARGSFLWRTSEDDAARLDAASEKVAAVAISQTQVATAGDDGKVRVWDVDGSQVSAVEFHNPSQQASALAFAPDQRLVIGERDGSVGVWDVSHGTAVLDQQLRGHAASVNAVAFSRDGAFAVTGSADGTAKVWDAATGRALVTLRGDTDGVQGAGFDETGRRVVTASSDGSVRIWDVVSGVAVDAVQYSGAAIAHMAVANDGAHAIGGTVDGSVTAWSSASDWSSADLASGASRGSVEDVAISPTDPGEAAAVFQDHTLLLFRFDGPGKPVTTKVDEMPSAIAFDPSHGRIVIGGSRGIEFRDARTGEPTAGAGPAVGAVVTSVAVSPDGRFIAYGDAQWHVWLWDTGEPSARLLGAHLGRVERVAFSPDGRLLASASNDGTAIVWNLAGGHVTLRGHRGRVNDVAFNRDGSLLVTGGIDGTIRVWTSAGAWRDLIDPQAGAVTSVSYAPDGQILASTDGGLAAFFACGLCVPNARPGSVVPDQDLMALAQHRVTRTDLTCGERVEFLNSGERCEPPSQSPPGASSSG